MNNFRKNKDNKGFTLLELLVVIAIIGILAGIILGSIQNSRKKAADKAIAENLISVRNEMAIFYSDYKTYGTYNIANSAVANTARCNNQYYNFGNPNWSGFGGKKSGAGAPNDPHAEKTKEAFVQANTQSGGTAVTAGSTTRYSNTRCIANDSTFAIAVTMKENVSESWCVDSNGFSGTVPFAAGASASVFENDGTGKFVCYQP